MYSLLDVRILKTLKKNLEKLLIFFFFLILGEKKDHQFAMPISVSVLLYTERCLDVIWMSERRLFLLGRRLYITESRKGRSGEIENVKLLLLQYFS